LSVFRPALGTTSFVSGVKWPEREAGPFHVVSSFRVRDVAAPHSYTSWRGA